MDNGNRSRRRLSRVTGLRPPLPQPPPQEPDDDNGTETPSRPSRLRRAITRMSELSQGSKVVIGLVVTTLVTGVTTAVFSSFSSTITDSIRPGPEIRVAVQVERFGPGGSFALPSTLPGNPTSFPIGRVDDLLRDARGAPVSVLDVRLIFEGNRNQAVTITDITAHILRRNNPLSGTLLTWPSQGSDTNLSACMDISAPAPIVMSRPENGSCTGAEQPYFLDHHIDLKLGEQYVTNIRVDANPGRPVGYYEWEFIVHAVVAGTNVTIPVRYNGLPFAVTSSADNYLARYGGDYSFFTRH